MNRAACLLVTLLFLGTTFAAVLPGVAPAGAVDVPPETQLRDDGDGHHTLVAIIEDEPGTFRTGERVSVEDGGRSVAFATYVNAWTRHAGGMTIPMVTYGMQVYAADGTGAGVRIPTVVLENHTDDGTTDPLNAALTDQVTKLIGADLASAHANSAAYATNFLLPSFMHLLGGEADFDGDGGYPFRSENYVSDPTVYMWFFMKNGPERAWGGLYFERQGSSEGAGTSNAEVHKRTEIGAATRTATGEKRWGGVFFENHAGRTQTATTMEAFNEMQVGIQTLGQQQGLLGVRMEDSRSDARGSGQDRPQEQHDRVMIGTHDTNGDFVPLFGAHSDNTLYHPDEEDAQTHMMSFGPYVADEFVPVLGVRKTFEDHIASDWALVWALGGTLGDQNSGDWRIDVGTFIDGAFVPLTGMQFVDRWEDAQYEHQTMVMLGAYADGDFEPLLAFAYSGEKTFGDWAVCLSLGLGSTSEAVGYALIVALSLILGGMPPLAIGGGMGARCQDWEMVIGTFVNDRFHPLLTVDAKDDYADAKYAYQGMVIIGTYAAGERVPLFGYTYSGELPLTYWALGWGLGGTLGAKSQDWRMEMGTFVDDVFKPLFTVDYKDDYAGADHPYQAMIVIGTVVEGKEQPLLGYTYDGEQTLLDWSLAFVAEGGLGARNALDWEMEIGTFVDDVFVPVIGWTYANDFDEARYAHQSEINVGIYALGRYKPLVGMTYDGETSSLGLISGGDVMVSVGTYAGDHYLPLLGVLRDKESAGTSQEEAVLVGTYLLGYDHFVPLAGVEDNRHGNDREFRAQAYLVNAPGTGLRLGLTNDDGQGTPYGTTTTASLILPGDRESQRLAVRYAGDTPLIAFLMGMASAPATSCTGCGAGRVTLGLEDPYTGAFTPVATVRGEPEPADQPYDRSIGLTIYGHAAGSEVEVARLALSYDVHVGMVVTEPRVQANARVAGQPLPPVGN